MFRALIVISLSISAIARAPQQGYSCMPNQVQCRNGSCVPFGSHCDDGLNYTNGSSQPDKHRQIREIKAITELCVLPQYPKDGTYKVANVPDAYPGQSFESLLLTVSCRRGYGVVAADNHTNAIVGHVYCINGVWQEKMPKCVRFCKVNPDPSVRYMCHVQGTGFKACDKYVAPGATVKPICNSLYHSNEDLPYMTCLAGFWNNVPHCKAAADRFWDEEKGYIRYSEWGAAAGQMYRLWDDEKNIHAQTTDVKGITLPDSYTGRSHKFQSDIAVLILVDPFVFNTYVRHVCLDWNYELEQKHLEEGNTGKIAGWGRSSKDSPLRRKVLQLNNISFFNCNRYVLWLQDDQICAAYPDDNLQFLNSNVGSGLVFAHNDSGVERFYLRGILTTKCLKDDLCYNEEEKSFVIFTKISYFADFLQHNTLLK